METSRVRTSKEKFKRVEDILRYLDLSWNNLGGKSILDVGAGTAELADIAYLNGINIICLDKKLAPSHLNPNIKYVVADARNMPFANQSFDYVLSIGLLSDIPEIESVERIRLILYEMKRILKPNGEIRFGLGIGNQDYIRCIEPLAEMVYIGNDAKGRPLYSYLIK